MEPVKISVASVHDDNGELVPYAYYVKQGNLQHGFFLADDYATSPQSGGQII